MAEQAVESVNPEAESEEKTIKVFETGQSSLVVGREVAGQERMPTLEEAYEQQEPQGLTLTYNTIPDTVQLVSQEQADLYYQTLGEQAKLIDQNAEKGSTTTTEVETTPTVVPETNKIETPPTTETEVEEDKTEEAQKEAAEAAQEEKLEAARELQNAYKEGVYGQFRGTDKNEPPSKAYQELMKEENKELRELLYGKVNGQSSSDFGLYDVLVAGNLSDDELLLALADQDPDYVETAMEAVKRLVEFKKNNPGMVEDWTPPGAEEEEEEVVETESEATPTDTENPTGDDTTTTDGEGVDQDKKPEETPEESVEGEPMETQTLVSGAEIDLGDAVNENGAIKNSASPYKVNVDLPSGMAVEDARLMVFEYEVGQRVLTENQDKLDTSENKPISSFDVVKGGEARLRFSDVKTPAGEQYMLILMSKNGSSNSFAPAASVTFTTEAAGD